MGGIDGLGGIDAGDADAIAARLAGTDAATWCERFVAAGGAAHTVVTPAEILGDPVAWKRGLLVDIGGGRLTVGALPRLSMAYARSGQPVFVPGVDGRSVIAELGLGESWEELVDSGAVVAPAG